jgi:hypothetical protein
VAFGVSRSEAGVDDIPILGTVYNLEMDNHNVPIEVRELFARPHDKISSDKMAEKPANSAELSRQVIGRSKSTGKFPLPLPLPGSMTIADAAKWYLSTVPQIDATIASRPRHADAFSYAWELKSTLRLAGAISIYDQEVADEFLQVFSLPNKDWYLKMASECSSCTDVVDTAIKMLLTVSEAERTAFPGTLGECLGLELWDGAVSWVMTKNGWMRK